MWGEEDQPEESGNKIDSFYTKHRAGYSNFVNHQTPLKTFSSGQCKLIYDQGEGPPSGNLGELGYFNLTRAQNSHFVQQLRLLDIIFDDICTIFHQVFVAVLQGDASLYGGNILRYCNAALTGGASTVAPSEIFFLFLFFYLLLSP